ncbi:TPA: ead/Ea22-like family protein [Enterobacter hormaechei subsp. hoffmannii]|nr:ead/Ea22-like family protein [Enterobacter hormaechei subsp. hoffmannii]
MKVDRKALREAAVKATPGRIGDRIDGSGSIKYQCFGSDGSLVLQTDHKNMEYGFIGKNSAADELLFRLCDPVTVLALLDELEAKDKRIAELEAREVVLPQRYSMLHRVDFHEPYHTEMVYKQHQVLEALHDAGVNIAAAGKGE